eukprot:2668763-Pyramimonas_sp.AAC.1
MLLRLVQPPYLLTPAFKSNVLYGAIVAAVAVVTTAHAIALVQLIILISIAVATSRVSCPGRGPKPSP